MKFKIHPLLLIGSLQLHAAETDRLAAAVQPYIDRQELAGAVMLVADREGVLATECAGWADIAGQKPMKPGTLFWIASQSKPMTAAAFMTLVDEGKVGLDDPVEEYLPEFRGQKVIQEKDGDRVVLGKPRHPITIREILSHTSGLPFKSAMETPTLDRFSLEVRVRSYAMTPLEFEPGSRYQYSNADINTAGRIIEVVTGMPYEAFLQERLLAPLGMMNTTFWPDEEQEKRIATSYKPGPGNMGLEPTRIDQLQQPYSDHVHRTPMPAGGLFSTAEDVSRFYRMLLQGGAWEGKRILSPEAVGELTRKQTPPDITQAYGLGFSIGSNDFGHGGAYSTHSFADKSKGLVMIWLVQHAGFPGEGGQAQQAFRRVALDTYQPETTSPTPRK